MISKKEIRFKNLPLLLNDMRNKRWRIDSFCFRYKNTDYIVILKLYGEKERKPSKYAVATVEFIDSKNENTSIKGYVDFFEVYFNNKHDFCEFFGVEKGNANRDLFKDFSIIFSDFIPSEKKVEKGQQEARLVGSRAEGNDPNAIYCYDVRRDGIKKDGMPKERSIENSNKAEMLRPNLYKRYCDEPNLSFCFSTDPRKNKSDIEIMKNVAKRKH